MRASLLTSYETPLILTDAWRTGPSGVFWVQPSIDVTHVVNVTCVRLHTDTNDFIKPTAVHIFTGGSSVAINQLLYGNLRIHLAHEKTVGDRFNWSI